jgi:hypothetical protein
MIREFRLIASHYLVFTKKFARGKKNSSITMELILNTFFLKPFVSKIWVKGICNPYSMKEYDPKLWKRS